LEDRYPDGGGEGGGWNPGVSVAFSRPDDGGLVSTAQYTIHQKAVPSPITWDDFVRFAEAVNGVSGWATILGAGATIFCTAATGGACLVLAGATTFAAGVETGSDVVIAVDDCVVSPDGTACAVDVALILVLWGQSAAARSSGDGIVGEASVEIWWTGMEKSTDWFMGIREENHP